MSEGQITLDQQRVLMFPVGLLANYTFERTKNPAEAKKLYQTMKKGMLGFSMPLGKRYGLSSKDFLDRWIKYNAFGGWGLVEYRLIETQGINHGFLTYKNLVLHLYLKSKGVRFFSDVLLNGIIAGALSTTFKVDVDVIETECVCSGSEFCVFNWGPKKYLEKEFPEPISRNKWW